LGGGRGIGDTAGWRDYVTQACFVGTDLVNVRMGDEDEAAGAADASRAVKGEALS